MRTKGKRAREKKNTEKSVYRSLLCRKWFVFQLIQNAKVYILNHVTKKIVIWVEDALY